MMARPLLIDTCILVDFLRGRSPAVRLITRNSDRIMLSTIVLAELFAGARGRAEVRVLDDLIGLFRVVPVSAGIARRAGELRQEFGPSHGVGLADALIAATAEVELADLKTLNLRHFPMFKGLRAPYTRA